MSFESDPIIHPGYLDQDMSQSRHEATLKFKESVLTLSLLTC